MAIKATGLGERYGLPGLTIVAMLIALWLGTRNASRVPDLKNPIWQHIVAIMFVVGAFWIGSENPDLFDGIPVLGKLME